MMKVTDEQITKLEKFRGEGMVSAVGEYTPSEFWDILDDLKAARADCADWKARFAQWEPKDQIILNKSVEVTELKAQFHELSQLTGFDHYEADGSMVFKNIGQCTLQRLADTQEELKNLRDWIQQFADEPCEYKDNCPNNMGTRHYTCLSCKARKILGSGDDSKETK